MTRSTLLLAVMTTVLGAGTFYFYQEHTALARSVVQDKERCTEQLAQLQSGYKAQLEELQQQLLQRQ
jgi:hypothetical protein